MAIFYYTLQFSTYFFACFYIQSQLKAMRVGWDRLGWGNLSNGINIDDTCLFIEYKCWGNKWLLLYKLVKIIFVSSLNYLA